MPVAEMTRKSLAAATAGFWGKIPSRGDFVGAGLSAGFVAAWDDWVSRGIAASREALAERWMHAWMEAPVWCFSAAPGLFGAAAVSGVWMPSVDRAGRAFPLVIATSGAAGADWHPAAETAGRAALAEMLDPDALSARIPRPDDSIAILAGSQWWTDGGPRVAPCRTLYDSLPDANSFARMLEDTA